MEPDLGDLNPSQKSYVCIKCKKVLASKTELFNHFKLHTDAKPHVCGQCDKAFAKKDRLKSHLLIHTINPHCYEKTHICNVCQKRFLKKSYLKLHQRQHTGEKPYVCDVCQKAFFEKSNLKKHLLLHTGEKPHACELCPMHFRLKHTLNAHLLIHTGEKPYVCDYCQKSFRWKTQFNKHVLQQHAGTSTVISRPSVTSTAIPKPCVCNLCQKSFLQKTHLNRHVSEKHTNISKHFPCNLCKKSFSSKCVLHQHLLSHTKKMHHVHKKALDEDKQNDVDKHNFQTDFSASFVDNFGQKSLSQKRDLNRIVSQSADLKSFVCNLCQESFCSIDYVHRHLLSHIKKKYYVYPKTSAEGTAYKHRSQTREEIFICKQCPQTFSEKAKLYRHLDTHAKKKPSVWDVCQKRLSQKKV